LKNCNIRVLEPEKLDSTKKLQEDCTSFVSKVDEVCIKKFQDMMILPQLNNTILKLKACEKFWAHFIFASYTNNV